MFAYIASSPFIIQNHYGYTALGFSLFFAANAVAIGTGAALAVKFKSEATCLIFSSTGIVTLCVLLCAAMSLNASVAVYEGLLFVLCLMLGLTFTTATARAMNAGRSRAGTASAVMGAAGFLFGSIVSPLAGIGNILLSSTITMAILALFSALSCYKALKLK